MTKEQLIQEIVDKEAKIFWKSRKQDKEGIIIYLLTCFYKEKSIEFIEDQLKFLKRR